MKNLFTSTLKTAAMAVGLFGFAASASAQGAQPGENVTAFVENEDMGLFDKNCPKFTTDEELNNWAWPQYNDGNTVGGRDDQRGWRGVFELNAPAAGKYGVEIQLRSTTNNWIVALTASQGLDASERANLDVAPDWFDFYRPTKMSVVTSEEVVIVPAEGDPIEDPDNYIPAITENHETFESGEWETIFVPVDLEAGHNYVTFWLSRRYWDLNTLTGPDGSINGFYVKSIKLLPMESGNAAVALQKASYKIWYNTWYPYTNVAGNANLKADYDTLLAAVAAGNYSASTDALMAGVEATDAAEEDLRTGTGFVLSGSKLAFDLPFYNYSSNTGLRENEHGAYSDAPVVFEYTNGKTVTWKFKSEVDGTFYPELYIGSQSETAVKVTILGEDQETIVMPAWSCPANTGDWQNYEKRNNSSVARFEAEAGKTYYIKLEFDQYANLRGLSVNQMIQGTKTYEELLEMMAKGEDVYAKFQPGTDGYFSIGGDNNADAVMELENALAMASDLDEKSTEAEITEAYYAIEEAIAKLETITPVNVIPADAFDFTNAEFYGSWTVEGGGSNVGYVVANGGANYSIYNKQDGLYTIRFNCSAPSGGGIMRYSIACTLEDGTELVVATKDFDILESGGWAEWEAETANYVWENVPVPAGSVQLQLFGVLAGGNGYIGNYNSINFEYTGGEGEGQKAFEAALAEYAAKYTSENLQALINEAQALVAQYNDADTYEQQLVVALQKAIDEAQEVVSSELLAERVNAYKGLETAMANMASIKTIEWQVIPSTEEAPFDLSKGAFTSWRVESAGNIGYGYQGGSVEYCIDVTEAGAYDMVLEVANIAEGGSIRATVTQAGTEIYNEVKDVPNTGSWNDHQDITFTMALPQAKVRVLLYGETSSGDNGQWVGNIYSIKFQAGDPNGISTVSAEQNTKQGVYTLQGVRVDAPAKGLYIVNGKKVLVK